MELGHFLEQAVDYNLLANDYLLLVATFIGFGQRATTDSFHAEY